MLPTAPAAFPWPERRGIRILESCKDLCFSAFTLHAACPCTYTPLKFYICASSQHAKPHTAHTNQRTTGAETSGTYFRRSYEPVARRYATWTARRRTLGGSHPSNMDVHGPDSRLDMHGGALPSVLLAATVSSSGLSHRYYSQRTPQRRSSFHSFRHRDITSKTHPVCGGARKPAELLLRPCKPRSRYCVDVK